jgi:hypothetical protein
VFRKGQVGERAGDKVTGGLPKTRTVRQNGVEGHDAVRTFVLLVLACYVCVCVCICVCAYVGKLGGHSMSICMSVCLSVYLSVCLSICLSVCLF